MNKTELQNTLQNLRFLLRKSNYSPSYNGVKTDLSEAVKLALSEQSVFLSLIDAEDTNAVETSTLIESTLHEAALEYQHSTEPLVAVQDSKATAFMEFINANYEQYEFHCHTSCFHPKDFALHYACRLTYPTETDIIIGCLLRQLIGRVNAE